MSKQRKLVSEPEAILRSIVERQNPQAMLGKLQQQNAELLKQKARLVEQLLAARQEIERLKFELKARRRPALK